MIKFFLGFIFGTVIASVGFGGFVNILDRGVTEIQSKTKELVK